MPTVRRRRPFFGFFSGRGGLVCFSGKMQYECDRARRQKQAETQNLPSLYSESSSSSSDYDSSSSSSPSARLASSNVSSWSGPYTMLQICSLSRDKVPAFLKYFGDVVLPVHVVLQYNMCAERPCPRQRPCSCRRPRAFCPCQQLNAPAAALCLSCLSPRTVPCCFDARCEVSKYNSMIIVLII